MQGQARRKQGETRRNRVHMGQRGVQPGGNCRQVSLGWPMYDRIM